VGLFCDVAPSVRFDVIYIFRPIEKAFGVSGKSGWFALVDDLVTGVLKFKSNVFLIGRNCLIYLLRPKRMLYLIAALKGTISFPVLGLLK